MSNTEIKNGLREPNATNEQSTTPYKLNLSLNPEAKVELDSLKTKTHKSSLVDVIRAALAVYKIVMEHQLSGGRVVLRDANNRDETLRIV